MFCIAITLFLPLRLSAQHDHHAPESTNVTTMEPQPLLSQALRLKQALSFLGSSLSAEDEKRLEALGNQRPTNESITAVQEILDPYCLAIVTINPEARVKVARGSAAPKLVQNGWKSFLVKVLNDAGSTAELQVESPNAVVPIHAPTFGSRVPEEYVITEGQAANRFLEMQVYRSRPLLPHL